MTDVKKSNLLFLFNHLFFPPKNISITHTHVYIASSSHELALKMHGRHTHTFIVGGRLEYGGPFYCRLRPEG